MIDLHAHSSASDGTQSPQVVVAEAARAGLSVVALTDHDTYAGWSAAAGAALEQGVGLVRGVEVSCSHKGISVHLLGYLVDPEAPGLLTELERARASRVTRVDRMVERMAADGIPVTLEQVRAQAGEGATMGRRSSRAGTSATAARRSPTCCAPGARTTSRTTPLTRSARSSWSAQPAAYP
jgi:3',5'-nucleoside bisphosphate phosphatase